MKIALLALLGLVPGVLGGADPPRLELTALAAPQHRGVRFRRRCGVRPGRPGGGRPVGRRGGRPTGAAAPGDQQDGDVGCGHSESDQAFWASGRRDLDQLILHDVVLEPTARALEIERAVLAVSRARRG